VAQTTPPENTIELPARLRVHALAKLLGVTSKAVLAELQGLGSPAVSVQSSIDRAVAERVQAALAPPPQTAAPAPLFIAPEPVAAPPRRRRASRPAAPAAPAETEAVSPPVSAAPSDSGQHDSPVPEPATGRTRRRRTSTPVEQESSPATGADTADSQLGDTAAVDDSPLGEDGEDGEPKRRRRGRRGRGRGRGPSADDESGESPDAGQEGTADSDPEGGAASEDADEAAGGSRRRRRRRRRKAAGEGDAGSGESQTDDDPPNTVVHERDPRSRRSRSTAREGTDDVQGITGSTRLEAKRQRRRDGRDVGRRRPPILSESEFLARREAVDRTMVVRQNGQQTQVAVLEDDVLVEHFVTSSSSSAMLGNIYLGRVQNVLPSMEAAFIDIGRGRNGVLYAGEVDWDAAGLGGKARKIEQALHSGDLVLVQVSKDPVGQKGARLTTQISLPGRFLVYVPGGGSTGISRKLPDTERKRLKEILKRIVPAEAGVIIRTASEGVSEEELARDVRRLQAQWEVISTKAEGATAASSSSPAALYEEPDLLVKVVRDLFNEDFSSLVVAGDDAGDTVENYVTHVAPELAARMQRYTGDTDVFTAHRIDEQLAKAMDRKVWLPSGGTLVIDRTEAMTVVDVNTGKFTGAGGNLEETVTRNNLEAAEEIVRQMRLRDIGGMIVVDFIDMVLESNRDLVLRRLTECLGRDRTRHQVSEVTSLGLVQMTRKRMGAGLIEEFSTPCEHCQGRGVLVQSEPVVSVSGGGARADAGSRSESGGSRRGHRGRVDRPVTSMPVVLDPGPLVHSTPPVPGPKVRPVATPAPVTTVVEETAADVHLGDPAPAPVAEVPVAEVQATDGQATDGQAADVPVTGRQATDGQATDGQAAEVEAAEVEAAEVPVVEEPATEVPAAAGRPRRRRAAGRPAGPPVEQSA